MRRTEWLQGTRKMRFERAWGDWNEGRLPQEEAARLLRICTRSFRRYGAALRGSRSGRPARSTARTGQSTARTGLRGDGARTALPQPACRVECAAFLRLVSQRRRPAQLHVVQARAAGRGGARQAARCAPAGAPSRTDGRHDAAPGWQHACVGGCSAVGPDRHNGRRHNGGF